VPVNKTDGLEKLYRSWERTQPEQEGTCFTRENGESYSVLRREGTIVNSMSTPSSIEGTIILLPIAAALGWAYVFVGHVGYAKQIAHADPERSSRAMSGVLAGICLVIFFRHIVNGQLLEALKQWFGHTLNDGNPLVMLFLGLPLALIVIAAGLAGVIGGFVGAAKGIGRLLYYLPGFLVGLPIVFHWLFVKHPTTPVILPALRGEKPIDTESVARMLSSGASDVGAKPVYHYQNQAEKARAVKEKLDADTEIAEATIRRERARAALLDAEYEVEEAKRRTGKRR
jgi:hypothetical protein